MRKLALFLATSAILVTCGHAPAWADDGGFGPGGQNEESSKIYGNLHGTFAADTNDRGTAHTTANLNGGGKFAYEGGLSELGMQFDADYWRQDYSWAVPSYAPYTGGITQVDVAAHVTQLIDQDKKIGAFVGYYSQNGLLRDTSGPTLSYQGVTGYNAVSTTTGFFGLGGEGLWAFDNNTSVQLRAAALTTIVNQTGLDTGTGLVNTGGFGIDFSNLGGTVSVGGNRQLNENWSLNGDLGMFYLSQGSISTNWLSYGGQFGAKYTFDGMPFSIGVKAGYQADQVNGVSAGHFASATTFTYSFGGPSHGAEGKLFRSGLFSFLN